MRTDKFYNDAIEIIEQIKAPEMAEQMDKIEFIQAMLKVWYDDVVK